MGLINTRPGPALSKNVVQPPQPRTSRQEVATARPPRRRQLQVAPVHSPGTHEGPATRRSQRVRTTTIALNARPNLLLAHDDEGTARFVPSEARVADLALLVLPARLCTVGLARQLIIRSVGPAARWLAQTVTPEGRTRDTPRVESSHKP